MVPLEPARQPHRPLAERVTGVGGSAVGYEHAADGMRGGIGGNSPAKRSSQSLRFRRPLILMKSLPFLR